ncbi:MAG: PA0069 family radical SAM protein [Pirellulales bacterium]|nr:PA0069 family radical SAM protein [Pirellulales bacterium]
MDASPRHRKNGPQRAVGRGTPLAPANRFESTHSVEDLEQIADDEEYLASLRRVRTQYLPDESQSIVSQNDSPDLGFRFSINPYRGCAHGCAYCYARPTHEYLGLNAGIDFETRVLVKHRAPELFRKFLARRGWHPEMIAFSGVTDCYQPAERRFRLTRGCLEVALECRQPVGVITKNALVLRDLDLLTPLAAGSHARVAISLTTLDTQLARDLEPGTSKPEARLRTIRALTQSGVPTQVMVAPIIPGLNDTEIPRLLEAAADAGACYASFVLLRLPQTVKPVFLDWLSRVRPDEAKRVESLIRQTREGKLNDSRFGSRHRGNGQIAEQIAATFGLFAGKFGLLNKPPPLDASRFVRPVTDGQRRLF